MQRKTASKEKIIQQAFRLFQKNGYTKTTTRMIAKAAGINEATIFNNFGNKANLFHEVYYILPPSIEQIPIDQLTNGRDLRHDIYVLINSNIHLMINNFPMYRFSMPLIDMVDEDLHARSHANIESINNFVDNYFHFLAEIGAARSVDTHSLSLLLQYTFLIKSFDLVRAMPDEDHPCVEYDKEATAAFVTEYTDYLYTILRPDIQEGKLPCQQ